ncbi:GPP34 family phosphoprotein [Micromonospora peucetia]|uniref:GPP34 family phosphoprotein n=1 Tax=Micromonospora peucetia TaxID=47871 RepID=A0A1C6UGW2_9ACTN|nr:GPP34 family phosphoprotein [Micromonospora peucetia]MCX4386739.1 GPP34 family phosphoprotein [Micromonospora peucetia]WSA34063.1 GPP34 family phosphoprotein [Micromonospora peucetia]SCL53335.1 Golgi phosphoprotein 3 (GPP34) [Micromonospora peucetia]
MTGVALAEELLLLAYDDETGKATMPRISLDLGMAAAVLIELALAGRIVYSEGSLAAVDPTPIGEPLADEVLARMAADLPRSPASWVQRLRHGLRDRILGDLCARGVVRDVDETELGFIHVHRYPTVDPAVEADTRRRLAEALASGELPDERTAALATLVAVLRMEPALGLTGDAAGEARHRLEEIAGGAGFSGTVSLDDSVVRPSVGLVVAALGHAVNAALGPRR